MFPKEIYFCELRSVAKTTMLQKSLLKLFFPL